MSARPGSIETLTAGWTAAVASVALICIALSTPAVAQADGGVAWNEQTATEEQYQRFEAERRRQQQVQVENIRLRQEQLRFENERLRQENERREQDRLRLENERLRQQNERHEAEQMQFASAARRRELAQTAETPAQSRRTDSANDPDIYEQLRILGQLKNDGILTEEEFQRLKKKILD